MSYLAPLHTRRNGHTTFRLQPSVIEIDTRRRIYRRRRTPRELGFDLVSTWVLPAVGLLFVAVCLIGVYWLGWAIDRAVRSIGGS